MTKLNRWKKVWAMSLVCAATAVASPEKTIFKDLASFDGRNGSRPYQMSLAEGTDGNFYGTTMDGGASTACREFGCGTVFKITPRGKLTRLYSFCAQTNCSDGAYPYAGLVQGIDGNFYGTTYSDGVSQCNGAGCGTVFKITPQGKLTTLHRFNGNDGFWPFAVLVQASDGNFYGTTALGGTKGGYGTVFKITPGGTLTTLHNFDGTDGFYPRGGMVQATDGNFYGTESDGGARHYGSVFKITPKGVLTTLHSFRGTDGVGPEDGLVQGTDGNFYGTTSGGGLSCNGPGCGTVFKITPGGRLTKLHQFGANEGMPYAGLIQATDGDFYGATFYGGYKPKPPEPCARYGCGTVFKITAAGRLTTLHSFRVADGRYPIGGVMQDTGGNFYGTTFFGGDLLCNAPEGCGTVYSLSTGLGPFVTLIRAEGRAGQTVLIIGQGFGGTSSVQLNGTPMQFTVVSDTYIRATAPFGGTTGYVTVNTPSGKLASNVPFRVIP